MASVNLMLPKEERKAMLLRIYNDDSDLIDHNQQKKTPKASQPEIPVDDVKAEAEDDTEDGGVKLPAADDQEMEDAGDAPQEVEAAGGEDDISKPV